MRSSRPEWLIVRPRHSPWLFLFLLFGLPILVAVGVGIAFGPELVAKVWWGAVVWMLFGFFAFLALSSRQQQGVIRFDGGSVILQWDGEAEVRLGQPTVVFGKWEHPYAGTQGTVIHLASDETEMRLACAGHVFEDHRRYRVPPSEARPKDTSGYLVSGSDFDGLVEALEGLAPPDELPPHPRTREAPAGEGPTQLNLLLIADSGSTRASAWTLVIIFGGMLLLIGLAALVQELEAPSWVIGLIGGGGFVVMIALALFVGFSRRNNLRIVVSDGTASLHDSKGRLLGSGPLAHIKAHRGTSHYHRMRAGRMKDDVLILEIPGRNPVTVRSSDLAFRWKSRGRRVGPATHSLGGPELLQLIDALGMKDRVVS